MTEEPSGESVPSSELVLVVDDDTDQRHAVRDVLEDGGYAVLEAVDGRQALDVLVDPRRATPCLMLLDLSMPRMTGWELLAILKNYVRLVRIPVVVMTGGDVHLEPLRHGSVDGILRKPFGGDQLLTAVANLAPGALSSSRGR